MLFRPPKCLLFSECLPSSPHTFTLLPASTFLQRDPCTFMNSKRSFTEPKWSTGRGVAVRRQIGKMKPLFSPAYPIPRGPSFCPDLYDHAGINIPADVCILHHSDTDDTCYCLFPTLTHGRSHLDSPQTYQSFISPPDVVLKNFFQTYSDIVSDERSAQILPPLFNFAFALHRSPADSHKLQTLALDFFEVLDSIVHPHFNRMLHFERFCILFYTNKHSAPLPVMSACWKVFLIMLRTPVVAQTIVARFQNVNFLHIWFTHLRRHQEQCDDSKYFSLIWTDILQCLYISPHRSFITAWRRCQMTQLILSNILKFNKESDIFFLLAFERVGLSFFFILALFFSSSLRIFSVQSSPVITNDWSQLQLFNVSEMYHREHFDFLTQTHRRYLSKKNSVSLLSISMRPSSGGKRNVTIFNYFFYIPRRLRADTKQWRKEQRKSMFICTPSNIALCLTEFSRACANCFNLLQRHPVLKCKQCKAVAYCNQNCQRDDWDRHCAYCV